jgi:hypothetical protein
MRALVGEVVELIGVAPDKIEGRTLSFSQGRLGSTLWIWKDRHDKGSFGWNVLTYDIDLHEAMRDFGGLSIRIEHPLPEGLLSRANVPQPACYPWPDTASGPAPEVRRSLTEFALASLRFVCDQHDLGELLLASDHVQRDQVWAFTPANSEPARLAQALLLAHTSKDDALESAALAKLRERGNDTTGRHPSYLFRQAVADWAKRYSKATGVGLNVD